jgi:uncharacterized membrane protein YgcG
VLALLAAVAAFISGVATSAGDTERIEGYWTSAVVSAADTTNERASLNEMAQVIEVIDYDFGSSSRRGIFRDVPRLDPKAPIVVTSPTAPDDIRLTADFNETRIRIGDPDQTIRGRHRYRIEYPVGVGQDDERISWNAVGTGWTVRMRNVEIHVLTDRELSNIQCSQGQFGAWGGCTATEVAPGHIKVEVDRLAAGEGITVSALPGAALAAAPTNPTPPSGAAADTSLSLFVPVGLAAAAFLAAAAVTSGRVRRAGREWVWAGGSADAAFGPLQGNDVYPTRRVDHDELADLASTEFAPPKGLTAWQGGVLYREGVDKDQQVAWLLEQAIAEQVVIEGTESTPSLRLIPTGGPIDSHLAGLFGGRTTLSLGAYDKQFASGWSQLGDHLGQWHNDSPYWDPAGERNRKRALGFGALLGLVGVTALVVSAVLAVRVAVPFLAGVALGAAVMGVGLALMVRSWELKVRTAEGSGLWILIESFRRFIRNSDAQHVDDAAKRGVLLDYTAWAVALGEVDRWSKAVKQADLEPQLAGQHSQAVFLTSMAPGLSSATAIASTKPSSSGGGGGGGVGGGGGGGGGGSW